MRILAILVTTTVLISCSSHKPFVRSDDQPSKPIEVSTTGDSLFLTFERTVCFGECPAYKLTIYADGKVKYNGLKFVERTGEYWSAIDRQTMSDIMNEADRINFFRLQDKYDAAVSDVPSTITMISGPNGRKRVVNRFQAPEELRSLEKFLDSILLPLDWHKP